MPRQNLLVDKKENVTPFSEIRGRRIQHQHFNFKRGRKDPVIQARGINSLAIGESEIDTLCIEQFAEIRTTGNVRVDN